MHTCAHAKACEDRLVQLVLPSHLLRVWVSNSGCQARTASSFTCWASSAQDFDFDFMFMQSLWRPEEGIRSPGTGITDKTLWAAIGGRKPGPLGECVLNGWAISEPFALFLKGGLKVDVGTQPTMVTGRLPLFLKHENPTHRYQDSLRHQPKIYYTELDAIIISQKPTRVLNLDFPVLKII